MCRTSISYLNYILFRPEWQHLQIKTVLVAAPYLRSYNSRPIIPPPTQRQEMLKKLKWNNEVQSLDLWLCKQCGVFILLFLEKFWNRRKTPFLQSHFTSPVHRKASPRKNYKKCPIRWLDDKRKWEENFLFSLSQRIIFPSSASPLSWATIFPSSLISASSSELLPPFIQVE